GCTCSGTSSGRGWWRPPRAWWCGPRVAGAARGAGALRARPRAQRGHRPHLDAARGRTARPVAPRPLPQADQRAGPPRPAVLLRAV
ncbi:MAG: hypothetical protein AVDCRST_MAG66-470, partial [uncultured Pseudonocardia sp.]